jgi:rubredoxin
MAEETCDVCGSTNIKEIKCKVVCQNCGTILKSCADLDRRIDRIVVRSSE